MKLNQALEQAPMGIIGTSPESVRMRDFAARAGGISHTVLLQGETGCGKDHLAEMIHKHGRSDRPFVPVDCGGLSETLLESELFGHLAGAFTDAKTVKKGLIQVAEGGTLFLNEIANLTMGLQAKFLQVMQKGTFRPVGGTQEVEVNTRIVTATNVNLERAVMRGEMRPDLFYRLNVIAFTVAPLRERTEDIPLLAEHFLSGEGVSKRFSQGTIQAMMEHSWSGNVRELQSAVARGVFHSRDQEEIQPEHLCLSGGGTNNYTIARVVAANTAGTGKFPTFREMEEEYYRALLERTGGNVRRAAEISGLAIRTIRNNL